MDREDGGARKRREAEGEGGLAGRSKARGREPAWRACASPGRGEGGGARGRERPKGEGRGRSGGAGSARTGAVSSGGGRREERKGTSRP